MPIKQSRHTLTGGMVLDVDKSAVNPNTYQESYNFRYLADKLGNTGLLYVPNAAATLINDFFSDEEIRGHCVIRDILILFTYRNISGGNHRIRKYQISNDTLINGALLHQSDSSNPTFSKTEAVSCVGRYENEDLIKVYWATKGIPIRMANVSTYLTNDGLIKSGSNSYLDVDRFNLITGFNTAPNSSYNIVDIDLSQGIISGGLTTGRYQYAISLLNRNGQESLISSLTTGPINIFNDSTTIIPSAKISGDDSIITTNKGIKLNLIIDSDDYEYFDRVRIYRIHYSSYGQLPTITILNDYELQDSSFSVVDTGSVGLGSFSVDEFSILSKIQLEAYTLTEKDNRLIAGNITENTYDVDWDARAYRFRTSDDTCHLYDEYGGSIEYIIASNGSVTDNTGGGVTDWEDIPETANCINPYNDISNDGTSTLQYIYQSNGTTLGAEGPNIKIGITTNNSQCILDSTSYNTTVSSTYSSSGTIAFPSISDFSNPLVASLRATYQREEVYRIGIVWINGRGQRSTVKWICDLRMPVSTINGDAYNIINHSSTTYINLLGINVTITGTIPTDATAWELVRVPRTNSDKTVIGAGAVIDTYNDGTDRTWRADEFEFAENDATSNRQVVAFINPENVYNKQTTIEIDDYLDIVHASNTCVDSGLGTTPNVIRCIKFYDWTSFTAFTNTRYSVDQNEYIVPTYDQNINNDYTITSAVNGVYRGWTYDGDGLQCPHGRSDILSLSSALNNTTLNLDGPAIGYGYVKRNNIGRYGGYTYSDRNNNSYISCGRAVPVTSVTSVVFYGGDTYINYFNYVYSMYTNNLETGDGKTIVLTFPVESTINLSLAHGNLPAKIHENFLAGANDVHYLKEEAGVWNVGSSIYTQPKDLYLYNTVYSQEQNIRKDIGYYDSEQQTEFDTRVYYSDYKLDNEFIDSWTVFRPNNFIDVTGTYGPLTYLAKYNNNIYFLQDRAIGILPINERALVQTNDISTLSLGTGDVLSRYDYINVFYGTQDKKSVDVVNSGIYFIDRDKRSLLRVNSQGFSNLGDLKGLRSYFYNNTPTTTPVISGNDHNGEVYIKYKDNEVCVFNTLTDNFTPFYTYNPIYMGSANTFSFYQIDSDDNVYGLYLDSSKYGRFDSTNYVNSSIKIIDNADYLQTKAYDNLIFHTTHKIGVIDNYDTTFDKVLFTNDYQTTGTKTLTIEDNLRKRERQYSLAVPRSISYRKETFFTPERNEKSGVDHTTVTSITRDFRERMRDKFIETTLTFTNDDTKSDGRLSVDYLIFNYRTSTR